MALIHWQYKVLVVSKQGFEEDERALNEFGAEGWELAGVYCHPEGGSALYLKRPALEERLRPAAALELVGAREAA